MFIVAASVLAFTFSDGELPLAKMCCMRGKTRDKYVCRRQIISRNAEMARVANVERGNFVSEYQWHILRTTNNIRPYPLPNQQSYFKSSTRWGKACLSIDPERGCAPVTSEFVF